MSTHYQHITSKSPLTLRGDFGKPPLKILRVSKEIRGGWGVIFLLFFLLPSISHASVLNRAPNNLGLVGYWSFDEGTSTKAFDYSGNKNTGTITGATWTSGKHGKALSFDGTVDNVQTSNGNSVKNQSRVTISAWVKPSRLGVNQRIYHESINGSESTRITLRPLPGNTVQFGGRSTDGDDYTVWVTSTATLNTSTWYHIVGVFNADTDVHYIYINGIGVSGNVVATPFSNTNPFSPPKIGAQTVEGAEEFGGIIDDVRIYNRALTAAEVLALYKSGEAKINASQTTAGGTLDQGLVGYWTFDGKDTNWGTGQTLDRSGQNNTGTLTNMSTSSSPTIGKIGQGLKFDGNASKTLDVPKNNLGVTTLTISAWIKPNTTAEMAIVDKENSSWAGYFLKTSTNGRFAFLGQSTQAYSNNNARIVGQWQHVTVTFSGGLTSFYVNGVSAGTSVAVTSVTVAEKDPNLHIGNGAYDTGIGSFPFNGSIDDVRIYNRALSAKEIKQLYLLGGDKINTSSATLDNGSTLQNGLVGLWTFDGKDLTDKVYDRSCGSTCTTGNNGYFIGGATSSAKTIGKMGQGLRFDSSDNVMLPPSEGVLKYNNFTVSGWTKAAATNTEGSIFGCDSADSSYFYFAKTANLWQMYLWNETFGVDLQVDTAADYGNTDWQFVTAVRNGRYGYLYVNGSLVGTGDSGTAVPLNTDIGAGINIGSGFPSFSGTLDDIRIYNRALSAGEVKQLYLMGK